MHLIRITLRIDTRHVTQAPRVYTCLLRAEMCLLPSANRGDEAPTHSLAEWRLRAEQPVRFRAVTAIPAIATERVHNHLL